MRMKLIKLASAGFSLSALCLSTSAEALTFNYSLRTNGAYQLDGPRFLGLQGDQSSDNFILDLSPRVLIEFNPTLTGYIRGRGFIPSGQVEPSGLGQPTSQRPVRRFGSLDEFWLQFNGLTNYPGESLRIGRQLIRQDDGSWLAQNADAVRFVFDTTLVSTDVGVVHQFSTYRTDNAPIYVPQRGRIYGFATIAADWRPEHRISLRMLHATDQNPLPAAGTALGDSPKLQDADLTWFGLYADNGYFKVSNPGDLMYRADFTYLYGQDRRSTPIRGLAGPGVKTTLGAFEASADLRWRPFQFPVQFGVGYTYSQGGGAKPDPQGLGVGETQYQQSGLQGNVSYFTGTPALIGRYNETLRAELGNLQVVTAFVSLNLQNNDVSIVYNNFRKVDGSSPIITDNVSARTTGTATDVGNGMDLILSHYFNDPHLSRRLAGDDDSLLGNERTSVRLRGSVFAPGASYGPGTRLDYRVLLEGTLWVE